MKFRNHPERLFLHLLTAPVIYSLIIPLIILDIWLEIYHRICFPAYGLPNVNRGNYIRIDRHKLKKLNIIEKLNCMYCGYANGLIHYAQVIAGDTEKYWCGIKHREGDGFIAPPHHKDFPDYDDPQLNG